MAANKDIPFEERKEMIITKGKKTRDNGSPNANKGSIAYMSKENVKEFNQVMEKRIFNSSGVTGRPWAFQSVEKLQEDITDYLTLCRDTNIMPTIVSLALYLGVDVSTIDEHANNSNSPFSQVFKNLKQYLHNLMQSGTLAGDINPVAYIFLSKNYFGMRDDKNITVTPTNNQTVNSTETMEAIQKQIEEENVPNADIKEN